jgi:hypothetical protein
MVDCGSESKGRCRNCPWSSIYAQAWMWIHHIQIADFGLIRLEVYERNMGGFDDVMT